VPVLVIHSEDDQIVPYADSAPLTVKLLKNGTLKTYKDLPHGCARPIRTSSMRTSRLLRGETLPTEEALEVHLDEPTPPSVIARLEAGPPSLHTARPPNERGSARQLFDDREEQMFPRLTCAELDRLRRFGECGFRSGERWSAQASRAWPDTVLSARSRYPA
jgi:hypothetical protein